MTATEHPRHTGITTAPKKQLMVFRGGHPGLAQEVAALLGTELVPTSAYDFANGEIYVRYEESVRGCDAFVIQSHSSPINESIMEQLIMVDALKRASAKRITVVLPFYGYARQDKKHRGREPISARLMADLFKTAGANRLMAVDLHTAQIQGFFDGPVDHLMALPILSEYVARSTATSSSPSSRRTRAGSRSPRTGPPGSAAPTGLHPQDPRHPPAQRDGRQPGRRRGRGPDLRPRRRHDRHRRDDHQGRRRSHGGGRQGRHHRRDPRDPLRSRGRAAPACSAREVIVTNTLPISLSGEADGLTVLSIAPLLSAAVREVFEDGSVTSLFGGRA